ncbi:hypothetical protein BKA80DRAFT_207314 [Phyllosticta citrichinensis]
MSHRRIKNIDFDDDDIDDYEEDDYGEEGEGGAPLRRHQMRLGKTKVREALGPDFTNIGDKQIEDALWNYYYDIEKSVTYLKSQGHGRGGQYAHKPAQTKKAKQPSRFDQAVNTAAQSQPKQVNGQYSNLHITFPLPRRSCPPI